MTLFISHNTHRRKRRIPSKIDKEIDNEEFPNWSETRQRELRINLKIPERETTETPSSLNKKCACDCVSGRGLSDWEHSRLRLSHPTVSSTPSPTRFIPLMLSPPPWSSKAPRPHTPDTSSTVRRQRQRPCALGTSAKRGTSGPLVLDTSNCILPLGVHPRIYSTFSPATSTFANTCFFLPNLIPPQLTAKHFSRTESHGTA